MPDRPTLQRLTLRARGRVQGVGYSAAVRKNARRLLLVGWVRDEYDGTVSVVAEGPRERLDELKRLCDRGTPFSRVDQLEVLWDEPTGEFPGFDLRLDAKFPR